MGSVDLNTPSAIGRTNHCASTIRCIIHQVNSPLDCCNDSLQTFNQLPFKYIYKGKMNYYVYDKELYSLVQAMQYFRHYHMGKQTCMHTYHLALISLAAKQN